MNQHITRRRFGQLLVAGTAVAGVSSFANRLKAQTPSGQNLVGVSLSQSSTTTANSQWLVQTSHLHTGKVRQQTSVLVDQPDFGTRNVAQTQTLQPYDQLGGLTSTADGVIYLATNATGSSQQAKPSRLTKSVGSSSETIEISGLAPQEAVWSLLSTQNGSLVGLVAKKNGSPPFRLVDINTKTGQVRYRNFTLPTNQWFSNLVQCPNGNIYSLSTGFGGDRGIVQLNLKQGTLSRLATRLKVNGVEWGTGLNSLTCSGNGQLYALGNPNKYDSRLALYTVDLSTGTMTMEREVAYHKVTVSLT